MSSNPISLNYDDTYDIGGMTVTLTEIHDAMIKASLYDDLKAHLKGGK